LRISAINSRFLATEDGDKFLRGKIVPFFKGKIRRATLKEVNEYEKKFTQSRPKLEKGFFFAVWIEDKNEKT